MAHEQLEEDVVRLAELVATPDLPDKTELCQEAIGLGIGLFGVMVVSLSRIATAIERLEDARPDKDD